MREIRNEGESDYHTLVAVTVGTQDGPRRVEGTLFGGLATSWDAPVTRVETTIGFRAARTVELRGGYQYNWRDGGRVTRLGFPTLQVLYWF